jgi:hypothetical protein
MSNLRFKINTRMDELEYMMNENLHLSNPEEVIEKLANVSKFWSVLDEEDRDYIQAARWALDEKQVWKDGT